MLLFDNLNELWLWQGYIPETYSEEEKVIFLAERNAAIKTAVEYSKEKYPESKREIYLVGAGVEPIEFSNLFPFWVPKANIGLQISAPEEVKNQGISLKYFSVS